MNHTFAPVVNDPKLEKHENDHLDLSLPTDDVDVRVELRKLGQPAALSGEGNRERRARLAALFNEQKDADSGDEDEESDEEFYTPGREDLTEIRTKILHESVLSALKRVAAQKAFASAHNFTKVLKHRRNIAAKVSKYELNGSYTMRGNLRMLSRARFNQNDLKIACSSWEGTFYVLQKDETGYYQETQRLALGFHSEMATIAWSPKNEGLLVSGGGEGKVNIWKMDCDPQKPEITPILTVMAHSKRIAQTGFHPSGEYFATTSFDQTWKFWDANRPDMEVFEQEGHSKEVFLMAFHPDGGLIATGGLDANGLLWDLRTGRNIAAFEGHVKGIYSMDFAPNGFHLATGSGDNSVKMWDLRKGRTELFSIPAHTKIVSDVRFLKGNRASKLATAVTDENDANPETLDVSGTCLVTCSYDNTVKVWSADNWVNITTLQGHTDRVLSCDISQNGETILSCGWDRTLRTWGAENL